MKVKKDELKAFLKKTKMEGDQEIKEAILKFDKEGLKIDATAETKLSRVMAWLNKSVFMEYEELGNVAVNDLPTIIKVIERFGENITLKKEGNLLTISGDGKSVDVELVNEAFVPSDSGAPNLEFDEVFDITASKVKDIFDDVKLNKDASITISTQEKKVIFSNTGKWKFKTEAQALTCKGGVSVTFGKPFMDTLNNLDSNLQLSVKSNYPAKIIEKTEKSVITIIVAPIVSDE